MSLGRQAAQGAIWNYSAFLVSKGLLFFATLVLARLLTPAEFGLVSMALLVITVLDVLRDFGIGSTLIYRQRDTGAANLAFFLSVGIGASLFLTNLALAPLAATFFKTSGPEESATLTSLLQVLGLSLLFSSLGSVHDALLQKDINYKRRMVPEVARTLVKGVLSVVLALMGWGAWSLVIGQVVGEACATILLWMVLPWRPSFRIDWSSFGPIVRYGSQIMTAGAIGTLLADVDYLIIGAMLGEAALGIYTLAFRIPELLIRNLAQAVSSVAFPVAARLQADRAAMREAYLMMQRYMLVILAPLGMGLYAITPALIHLLFSPSWAPAIPVMQILCICMVLGGINHWPGVVYKAVGRPDILNVLGLSKLVMLVPTLWWAAANYGIVGVAWGQVAVRLAGILIDMWAVSRFVEVSVLRNLRVIWPPLLASVIMALAVQALLGLLQEPSSILALTLAILFGATLYGALIWLLDRSAVQALSSLALGMVRRKDALGKA
jgi:O-antigen/teichoic acid export membrane protein